MEIPYDPFFQNEAKRPVAAAEEMSRPCLEVADLVRAAGTAFIERNRKRIGWAHIVTSITSPAPHLFGAEDTGLYCPCKYARFRLR